MAQPETRPRTKTLAMLTNLAARGRDAFAGLFRRPAPPPPKPENYRPEPDEVRDALQNRSCFYCNTRDRFLEGPSGGAALNIQCDTCGQKICFAAYDGDVFYAEEIGYDADRRKTYLGKKG